MAKKILLIDDDIGILESLKMLLENEGIKIITAMNGVEGLEKIREQSPDLIILDILMPKKNGWEVCSEIRKDPIYKNIPIIILTEKNEISDQIKGYNLRADFFISKPFNPLDLIARVKYLLNILKS